MTYGRTDKLECIGPLLSGVQNGLSKVPPLIIYREPSFTKTLFFEWWISVQVANTFPGIYEQYFGNEYIYPLSTNPTEWSNALKQFVGSILIQIVLTCTFSSAVETMSDRSWSKAWLSD